jgi:hypothetical protein
MGTKTWVGLAGALTLSGLLLCPGVRAEPVYSDQDLMEWARDTYDREDWIYAYAHLHALIQRNPPLLRNNPALRNQVNTALEYSGQRLLEMRDLAQRARAPTTTSNGGVSGVSSGLGSAKPKVDFPR